MRLWRRCDAALNGLQSHFQATDKFDANIDADTWCNSTGQNSYIWFGSDLAAASQTLDVNEPLHVQVTNRNLQNSTQTMFK